MSEPQEGNQQPAGEANLNPDLAGYPTTDALVKGYRESGNEAKRQRERAEAAEHAYQELIQSQANPRPQIPTRSARPEDRLSEFGVPVDALDEYFEARMQKAFAPIAQGMSARTELLSQYPDYNKFEADVAAFIQSDPKLNQSYQRMFNADPLGAFEYAFLKFGDSRRRSGGDYPSEVPGEASHAQLPGSRNGDAMRQPQGSPNVQRLYEEYQRTGSPNAAREYAKARLHTVITDDFLNA